MSAFIWLCNNDLFSCEIRYVCVCICMCVYMYICMYICGATLRLLLNIYHLSSLRNRFLLLTCAFAVRHWLLHASRRQAAEGMWPRNCVHRRRWRHSSHTFRARARHAVHRLRRMPSTRVRQAGARVPASQQHSWWLQREHHASRWSKCGATVACSPWTCRSSPDEREPIQRNQFHHACDNDYHASSWAWACILWCARQVNAMRAALYLLELDRIVSVHLRRWFRAVCKQRHTY
jgi:hypothetical protein